MNPPTATPDGAPDVRPWIGRAALIFVMLSLATLVIVPIVVQRRVDSMRTEIEASEPARTLVARLRYNLVREMAALNEIIFRGDTTQADAFASATAAEGTIYPELAPLAARLGADVTQHFAATRAATARWHVWADYARVNQLRVEGTAPSQTLREQQLFEDALRATVELDSAILAATAQSRQRIASTERMGLQLTVLLGVLALMAASAAAMLYRRVRRFAAESSRRRDEAERALAETARADAARIRLLRGITHDVKNPLGAAQGYAELLAMGIKAPLLPEQAPLVEGVQRSVDNALAIIADLLDVARADSGGLTVNRVQTDLVELARLAVTDHRASAEAAGHTLHLETSQRSVSIYTDPARVRQVLGNLLSNAIKYTPAAGRITVRATTDGGAAPGTDRWAVLLVADTGPGIPPESREAIFDEFTRMDAHAGIRGHGLGLAIARRIARLLDGDLTLSDGPGPGATFELRLPLRKENDGGARSDLPQ